MAKLIDIAYQGWQNYEKGANKPGSEVLESLAKLGFNINWILTGEGLMSTGIKEGGLPADVAREIKQSYIAPGEVVALPDEAQAVVDAVIEVMTSDYSGVKMALSQNALMFQEMVRNKKEIGELKRDMESFKKIFKEGLRASEAAQDTDLKKAAG